MNDLKYIIVSPKANPKWLLAIVFNGLINHSDVVPDGFNAISAGYCIIDGYSIKVYGGSASLNLNSKSEDVNTIHDTLNRNTNFYY